MPRYKLTIEYDGTQYAGWQKQPDQPTVQQKLGEAVKKFCGIDSEVVGAGRTDAGVHAIAQVSHVDLPKEYDDYSVMQGLNFYLFNASDNDATIPTERIAVTNAERVSDDFNARFSATRRHYIYRIINRRARLGLELGRAWQVAEELDIEKMQQTANYLVGTHDFNSFRDTACQAKSPIKTLEKLDIQRQGDDIIIQTNARSFLHHQVRIMVGTLALVGKGRWSPADVKAALEAKNRAASGPTAPAGGLYLLKVDY
ncbi:MAG: tRNA pseudouridine(38-40) synthase TruA [Alphaproteobacteria bacterium]